MAADRAVLNCLYPDFAITRHGVSDHLKAIKGLKAKNAAVVRAAVESDIRDGYPPEHTADPGAERLQLLAARLERRPIAIMPHKCKTVDEWLERYAELKNR